MKTTYLLILLLLLSLSIRVSAQIQNSIDLDGIDDFVTIADNPTLDGFTAFTIEAWVKLSSMDANKGIVAKRQGSAQTAYVLMIRGVNNRRVYFRVNAEQNTFFAPFTLTIGRWHHIAAVFNGNAAQTERKKIYIDGILRATGASNETSVINSVTNLTLGWINGNLTSYLNGSLDEVRLWNVERTQAQIRTNMYRELINPIGMANLAAYYNFNQNSGNLLPDESANTNDGILANMDPATDWIVSTAPIPYYTVQDGNWNTNATWASGQYFPVNDWSRVIIDHQIHITNSVETREVTINTGKMLAVDPNASCTVNNLITNNAGNGGMVVKATAAGMGSLIHNTPNVPGTVEQYITSEAWHYISSPVASAVSMVYLDLYLMKWSEPTNLWTFISATNVPLNVTQGYATWASNSLTGTTTVYFTGNLNTGDKATSLTYTPGQGNGWNFIGNPYPSSIDWNSNWVSTNVDPTCYAWSGSQYLTWNYITEIGTKTDGTIPVSQGFFVKANAASPSLTIPQSERIHGSQPFYKADEAYSYIRLIADGNGYSDQAIIGFDKDATPGFDSRTDAWKLWGIPDAPQMYSIENGDELMVNFLKESTQMANIGFSVGFPGTYTIILDQACGLFTNKRILIEDRKEDIIFSLDRSGKYIFTASPADDPQRFAIHFAGKDEMAVPHITGVNDASIYSYAGRIYVRNIIQEPLQLQILNMTGQLVYHEQLDASEFYVINPGLKIGSYLLTLKGSNTTFSGKVFIRTD